MGAQGSRDDAEQSGDEQQQRGDQHARGSTGEGAASAMHHMISQIDRKRNQSGDTHDEPGHPQ
jgi:hypothetical protein